MKFITQEMCVHMSTHMHTDTEGLYSKVYAATANIGQFLDFNE